MLAQKLALCATVLILACASSLTVTAQTDPVISAITAQAYRATNVRSGPDVSFDIVTILQEGRAVPVTGRSDVHSNWLRVRLGTQEGWVAYFTVATQGDLSSLPIIEIQSSSEADTTPPPDLLPAPPPGDIFATTYRRVNMRSGPGTEFPVLGVLDPGQTADIVGTSGDDNEWLQVEYNGVRGWVAYFVVSVSGDLAGVDIITPLDLAEEVENATLSIAANQVVLITRFNTNLRLEPAFNSDVLTVVPFETTLPAEARTEDRQWFRVTYEGQTGWLIASLVNTGVSDVRSLPVADEPDAEATEEAA